MKKLFFVLSLLSFGIVAAQDRYYDSLENRFKATQQQQDNQQKAKLLCELKQDCDNYVVMLQKEIPYPICNCYLAAFWGLIYTISVVSANKSLKDPLLIGIAAVCSLGYSMKTIVDIVRLLKTSMPELYEKIMLAKHLQKQINDAIKLQK